jgi:hypothetical protein
MSTKTTFKRVALVAVASMGFGVLTSVAPATAATAVPTAVTALAIAPVRVGVDSTANVAVTIPTPTVIGDTFTVTATVISRPATSAATVQVVTGTVAAASWGTSTTKRNATVVAAGAASQTVASGLAAVTTTTETTSYVGVTLAGIDKEGTYTVLFSVGNATYVAGDKSTTLTFTTVGAPSTITLSGPAGTTIPTAGAGLGNGIPLKIVVKDANGVVTKPNAFETIGLTVTTGSATLSKASLSASDFASGAAYVTIKDTIASDVVVITAAGSGMITAAVTTTLTMSSSKDSGTAAGTPVWQYSDGTATKGFKATDATHYIVSSAATSASWSLKTLTANGLAADTTSTVKYTTVAITDTTGHITGVPATVFDVVVSQAGLGATVSSAAGITATLGTTGSYTMTALAVTLYVTAATPVASTTGAIAPAIINTATGSVITVSANITDQFANAWQYAAVAVTVAGRNTKTSNLVSDADGNVSYSYTDSGTAGTSDLITFTGPGTAATRAVTYGTYTPATLTLTGGSTTAGVTAAVATVRDINAGDGVEATQYGFIATVKDANGALLTGVPVTFTISGTTGAAITSTTKTVATGAAGTATAQVYGWVAGTYTVTATAGTISGTGAITFGQTAKGEERSISVKASGPIATATVVDRFGNPVPGVTVYATKTGDGFFGAGVTKTSGTTDSAGQVEFVITGGSADVTVSTINYADVAGTYGSGQTSAPKGYLTNARTAAALALLAFTASTTGTALVAETYVGASIDAAGVASATVALSNNAAVDNSQAAADAAAEATDAANAATDAANAAAEAADAATAAAQDAADAVAALSTQVSEMVNALKKQITALTNLVIKIQKKVKA